MLPTGPSFHVHPETGEPGRCRAHLHSCPFSTEDNHFSTKEEARAFYEDYASKLTDSTQSVEFHFVTDEEETHFTDGDCGILARAIHRKTGWPLVLASSDGSLPLDRIDWDHMAVRAPDGRIIDAVGMSTEADFREAWGGAKAELTEISGDQWATVHRWGQQFESSPVKVANRILKSLKSLGIWAEN